MKIYTKTGDKGATQVYSKEVLRVQKSDPIIETYGTLDELNASVGLLASQVTATKQREQLTAIQHCIFNVGFAISDTSKLTESNILDLERWIDDMQSDLPPQTSFILPGGCMEGSQSHVCRTIARRAERRLVELNDIHTLAEFALQYINRLSDYLFVLARCLNAQADIEDVKV